MATAPRAAAPRPDQPVPAHFHFGGKSYHYYYNNNDNNNNNIYIYSNNQKSIKTRKFSAPARASAPSSVPSTTERIDDSDR